MVVFIGVWTLFCGPLVWHLLFCVCVSPEEYDLGFVWKMTIFYTMRVRLWIHGHASVPEVFEQPPLSSRKSGHPMSPRIWQLVVWCLSRLRNTGKFDSIGR